MLYLVLSGNSLQIVTNKGIQTLNFPSDVVRYQEIVNRELFEKLISEFFAKSQKHEAGIFLDPHLVYHKAIPSKTTADQIQEEEEKFFSSVPLGQSATTNLTVHGKSEIIFLSTNKHIFRTLIDILSEKGWRFKFVTPLTVFSENLQGSSLSYQLLRKFEKQGKLIKNFNFLFGLVEEKPHEKTPVDRRVLILVAIMALCFTVLGTTIFFSIQNAAKNSTLTPTPSVTISPTIVPTTSPAASMSASLSKEEIKIQIFNGSGTPGEATTISNNLKELGYTNIEIGDAEGAESNTTIVIFSERTPKVYRDEILSELNKSFSTIETQEIATSDSYDVFITTGATL